MSVSEPAWIGIISITGKSHFIWYIGKVYTAKGGISSNSQLLVALRSELNDFFGADKHFTHGNIAVAVLRW